MTLAQYPGHWTAAALVALMLAAYVAGFWSQQWRRLPARRFALPVLQIMPALILLAILWDPSRSKTHTREVPNTVLAVFDTSASMSVNDVDGGETRLTRAVAEFHKAFPADSEEKPDMVYFAFDRVVREASGSRDLAPIGTQTQLWDVLHLLERNASVPGPGERPLVAGAIVFTDGQAYDRPRELAPIARDVFPIAVVGVGSTERGADVAVARLEAPERVRVDSAYPVEVVVAGQLDEPAPVFVELRVDDVPIAIEEVAAAEAVQGKLLKLNAPATTLGLHVVEARATTSAHETVTGNNSRKIVVDVVEEPRLRTLFYSQWASPDMGKIRQALEREQKVALDFELDAVIRERRGGGQIALAQQSAEGFPKDAQALAAYDVVVLGPCDPQTLSNQQKKDLYNFVAARGGGLLLLPGSEKCDLAISGDQDIRALLPGTLEPNGDVVARPGSSLKLTEEGRRFMKFPDEGVHDAPQGLAPYYAVEVKPAATIAATFDTTPAVLFQRVGRGHVCMLNLRHLYLLYREDEEGGALRALLSTLVTHLGATVRDEANVDVFAERDPARLDTALVTAYVRDPQFQPATSATVLLTVDNIVRYMTESGSGEYRASIPAGAADTLLLQVEAARDGILIGRTMRTARLPASWTEMQDVTMDREYLQGLASQLGATYLDVDDASAKLARMFPATSEIEEVTATVSSWRTWVCLTALCGMLTAGWFARRMMGLV